MSRIAAPAHGFVGPVKRSITIAGHQTSISLEPLFWAALERAAARRSLPLNALELSGKRIEDVKIVLNGAGAAGIACLELLKAMGARHENCIMCDTKGVIYQGRTEGMNQWKSAHAVKTDARTLTEAVKGADVFLCEAAFEDDRDDHLDGIHLNGWGYLALSRMLEAKINELGWFV